MRAFVINDTRREVGHTGCHLVMANLFRACQDHNIAVIGSDFDISTDFDADLFRKKIAEADCLVINGEGTLHHNNGIGLIARSMIAKEMDKKVFLVNSVWQSNYVIKRHLDLFDGIYVRESLSQDELRHDGCMSARVVPDLSFYKCDIENVHTQKSRGAAVIDSVLLGNTVYLSKLALVKGYDMLFMGRWHNRRFIRDNPFLYLLLKIRKPSMNRFTKGVQDIAGRPFVISGRFHAVCMAMMTNVPCIAISSNTHKVEGLFTDAGIMSDYLITQSELSKSALERACDFLLANDHGEYLDRCREYIVNAQSSIDQMFNDIAEV